MENGSSGGARPLPFSESHDEFLELCALSTANALSPEDRERLDRHLAGCSECRETLAQYQELIDAGIPAAALSGTRGESLDSDPDWSLEEAEARLLTHLEDERRPAGNDHPAPIPVPSFDGLGPSRNTLPPLDSVWRHMWLQSAAALLLVIALGYSVYRMGMDRGARTEQIAAKALVPLPVLPSPAPPAAAKRELAQAEAAVRDEKTQLTVLDARVRRQTARIADLEAQSRQAQADLADAAPTQARLEEARDNLARQLAAARASLEQARQRLADVAAEDAGDAVKVIALRRQIEDLNRSLAERGQDLARAEVLLDHDQDIRDLMASRNLYIAEVYDVARNGQTKKPFGRVFYTKGKSLIFYAYDLDEQRGVRDTSTFQAWGSRGLDRSKAVSLGIFYQDRAAKTCWILKAENPKVLSGIDAVFVTVEPHGGSSHPSGKPLLYAYLHVEPNHP